MRSKQAGRTGRPAIHAALACVLVGCLGPWLLGVTSGPVVVVMATCGVMAAIGCAAIALDKYRDTVRLILLLATISLLLSLYSDLPLLAPYIPLHYGAFFLFSLIAVVLSAAIVLLWEAE